MAARSRTQRESNRSRGISLVEVAVSIGLLSLVMTLAGSAIFLSLGSQGKSRSESIASRDLRRSLAAFGQDAARAETVDLDDGAGPVTSLVITWPDTSGALRTSTFSVSGGNLTRDVDGAPSIIARDVNSVAFDRSGKTLEMDLVLDTSPGETKSQSLKVYAGRLP